MRITQSKGVLAGALVCGLSGIAFGEGAATDVQAQLDAMKAQVAQLQAQNQDLKTQVATIQTQKGETWLNERRAEEVRALVKEVLADADTRASLLENGMTAGHNGTNFFLASEDGTFLLKIWGQLQIRYINNFRDDPSAGVAPAASNDPNEGGFQIRRSKLGFEGFVGGPKIEYRILLAPNRDSGTVEIEDAWIAYNFTDNLRIWAGRFQDRFSREAYMSSKNQQTVDRSAVAYIFAGNDGFVEGAGLEWKVIPDWLMLAGTVNDGLNSGAPGGTGTGFQNGAQDFNGDATDVAFTGRADLKLAGDWKQMGDVESWSSAKGLQAFLGAAAHYEVGETGDAQAISRFALSGNSTSPVFYDHFLQWTVDGIVKVGGLGVMGAFYGWHIYDAIPTGISGSTPRTLDNYAATLQAGYMVIPDKLEPFVRYEWISVDDDLLSNDLNLITGGFNYFIKKHAAKFSLDAVWALNNINAANTMGAGLTGCGLLPDSLGQNDQVTVRAQFQLLF